MLYVQKSDSLDDVYSSRYLVSQYISWIANAKLAWTLNVEGMAADSRVGISARPVPQEPMVSSTFCHNTMNPLMKAENVVPHHEPGYVIELRPC